MNITIDGNATNQAKGGDTVTLTINPDDGYVLKDISITSPGSISDIDTLVGLMGDAVFQGVVDNDMGDFTGLICKVNEAGHFVVMNGGEVIAELTAVTDNYLNDVSEDFGTTMIYIGFLTDMSEWRFLYNGNEIISINIYQMGNHLFYGEGTSTGTLIPKKLALTTVTEGRVYTFVMPEGNVNIVATFEEHVIPAHDHDETTLELVEAKVPTCTEAGNIAYYHCTVCDEYFADVNGQESITLESTVIAALGYEYQFVEFVWDGFTAQAKYVRESDNSHVAYYDTEITSQVTTAATFDDVGVRTYTATYDNHTDTKTETIKALGHDITHHDGKAATCTENGWDEYETCSRWDFSTYEEIPATGYSVSDWIVTKEPTCTEKGSKHKVCTVCGAEIEVEEIAANGHTAGDWIRTCKTILK